MEIRLVINFSKSLKTTTATSLVQYIKVTW